jgi:hypothetical protein
MQVPSCSGCAGLGRRFSGAPRNTTRSRAVRAEELARARSVTLDDPTLGTQGATLQNASQRLPPGNAPAFANPRAWVALASGRPIARALI